MATVAQAYLIMTLQSAYQSIDSKMSVCLIMASWLCPVALLTPSALFLDSNMIHSEDLASTFISDCSFTNLQKSQLKHHVLNLYTFYFVYLYLLCLLCEPLQTLCT